MPQYVKVKVKLAIERTSHKQWNSTLGQLVYLVYAVSDLELALDAVLSDSLCLPVHPMSAFEMHDSFPLRCAKSDLALV